MYENLGNGKIWASCVGHIFKMKFIEPHVFICFVIISPPFCNRLYDLYLIIPSTSRRSKMPVRKVEVQSIGLIFKVLSIVSIYVPQLQSVFAETYTVGDRSYDSENAYSICDSEIYLNVIKDFHVAEDNPAYECIHLERKALQKICLDSTHLINSVLTPMYYRCLHEPITEEHVDNGVEQTKWYLGEQKKDAEKRGQVFVMPTIDRVELKTQLQDQMMRSCSAEV